jgi:hypothetical protein
MIFRERDSAMGWVVRGEQGIEKAMEFALPCITNVADLHWAMASIQRRLPQGVSKGRVCVCKLIAIGIIVSHWRAVSLWVKVKSVVTSCHCFSNDVQDVGLVMCHD